MGLKCLQLRHGSGKIIGFFGRARQRIAVRGQPFFKLYFRAVQVAKRAYVVGNASELVEQAALGAGIGQSLTFVLPMNFYQNTAQLSKQANADRRIIAKRPAAPISGLNAAQN